MTHTLRYKLLLSAPIASLTLTNGQTKHFLIDSGFPNLGFSTQGSCEVVLGEGGLYPDRTATLPAMPQDLSYLSEMLGLEISGMIGGAYLRSWPSAHFDHERGLLTLGEAISPSSDDHQLNMTSPFMVEASTDGRSAMTFIDTGSKFNISLGSTPSERLMVEVPSFHGMLNFSVFKREVSVRSSEGETISKQCAIATGAPAPFPMLGAEWLSKFAAVSFDFQQGRLVLTPKSEGKSEGKSEESPKEPQLDAYLYSAPFIPLLNPSELESEDRSFSVKAFVNRPLPAGLREGARYKLKGFKVPAGDQGCNALFHALSSDTPDEVTLFEGEGEVTFSLEALL